MFHKHCFAALYIIFMTVRCKSTTAAETATFKIRCVSTAKWLRGRAVILCYTMCACLVNLLGGGA